MNSQDYYFDSGRLVLTESFLLRRGFCCGNGCRHCPYEETWYVVRTSDDLMFHLKASDPRISGIEKRGLPLLIEIEESVYNIISFERIR